MTIPHSTEEVDDRELLDDYSRFLEEYGYLDSDWYSEEPKAIDRFFEERRLRNTRVPRGEHPTVCYVMKG